MYIFIYLSLSIYMYIYIYTYKWGPLRRVYICLYQYIIHILVYIYIYIYIYTRDPKEVWQFISGPETGKTGNTKSRRKADAFGESRGVLARKADAFDYPFQLSLPVLAYPFQGH